MPVTARWGGVDVARGHRTVVAVGRADHVVRPSRTSRCHWTDPATSWSAPDQMAQRAAGVLPQPPSRSVTVWTMQ